MGLRINTNPGALSALRNLRIADRNLNTSMERLSTGLRINRASDDPSGLVISEQLRGQVRSLHQALQNTENANNLIGTAEAALSQVSDLLIGIRESAVFALNTGGASQEQIDAEQAGVDQALSAIDHIAATTRFGRTNLLDGSSDFKITAKSTALTEVNLRSMNMDGFDNKTVQVRVTRLARQASRDTNISSNAAITGAGGQVIFTVSGNRGTATLTLGATQSGVALRDAINLVAQDTGVYVSRDANSLVLRSLDFGTDAFVSLQKVGGSGSFNGATEVAHVSGVDVGGRINGVAATGKGERLSVSVDGLNASVLLAVSGTGPAHASGAATGLYTFTVRKSGLNFQMGTEAQTRDALRVGIQNLNTALLGTPGHSLSITGGGPTVDFGGYLNQIRTGGDSDLNTDPTHALQIIDAAIDDVSGIRSYLGSLQSFYIEPTIDTLGVSIENLQASESQIRDLDFAAETTNFTARQIQFQAATAVLAAANLNAQSVLTLLA